MTTTPSSNARRCVVIAGSLLMLSPGLRAQAQDPVRTLREFVSGVQSGQARFVQTVTSPDGKRTRTSRGEFEFQRPNRFRFAYDKPVDQLIIADGSKVWIHDADLGQASSRPIEQALGATPAALLTGGRLDAEFTLSAEPAEAGVQWVRALPRSRDSAIQQLRVGLRDAQTLVAFEIVDGFGQRSRMQFSGFVANPTLTAERFRFVPPPGTAVIEQ
jgi:outer membrane lipoprotein carrier protein